MVLTINQIDPTVLLVLQESLALTHSNDRYTFTWGPKTKKGMNNTHRCSRRCSQGRFSRVRLSTRAEPTMKNSRSSSKKEIASVHLFGPFLISISQQGHQLVDLESLDVFIEEVQINWTDWMTHAIIIYSFRSVF